jgi:hypothetical protein
VVQRRSGCWWPARPASSTLPSLASNTATCGCEEKGAWGPLNARRAGPACVRRIAGWRPAVSWPVLTCRARCGVSS